MNAVNSLEKSLTDVYKNAPKLPSSGKKFLVQYLPWISGIGGVLMLFWAWSLYDSAHGVNKVLDYANAFYKAVSGKNLDKSGLNALVWIGVITLVVQGVIYLAAVTGLRDRKKSGWNLLFYAALINVLYGVLILFSDYGGVGTLLVTLVSSAVALWLLFQVRDSYNK